MFYFIFVMVPISNKIAIVEMKPNINDIMKVNRYMVYYHNNLFLSETTLGQKIYCY